MNKGNPTYDVISITLLKRDHRSETSRLFRTLGFRVSSAKKNGLVAKRETKLLE